MLLNRTLLPGPDGPNREIYEEQPGGARARYQPREGEPLPPWRTAATAERRHTVTPPPGLERPASDAAHPAPDADAKGAGKGQASLYTQTEADQEDNPWSSMTDEPQRHCAPAAASADSSAPTWYVPPGAGRDLPRRPTAAAASSSWASTDHGASRRQTAASHSTWEAETDSWTYPTQWSGSWRAEDHHAWREWRDDYEERRQQEQREQARREGIPRWNDARWCPSCRPFGADWDTSCGMCGLRYPDYHT